MFTRKIVNNLEEWQKTLDTVDNNLLKLCQGQKIDSGFYTL